MSILTYGGPQIFLKYDQSKPHPNMALLQLSCWKDERSTGSEAEVDEVEAYNASEWEEG